MTHIDIFVDISFSLLGEIEVARALNVGLNTQTKKNLKLKTYDDKLGILLITNFRLSFVAFDHVEVCQ
jgi:hypothetical protein